MVGITPLRAGNSEVGVVWKQEIVVAQQSLLSRVWIHDILFDFIMLSIVGGVSADSDVCLFFLFYFARLYLVCSDSVCVYKIPATMLQLFCT
jgi:hypothetical protein